MAQMLRLTGKRFEFGVLVLTAGVNSKVADNVEFAKFVWASIKRYGDGDWGDMDEHDKAENEFSIGKHLRIFSAYEQAPLLKIWVITEADRSATTVLFPNEY